MQIEKPTLPGLRWQATLANHPTGLLRTSPVSSRRVLDKQATSSSIMAVWHLPKISLADCISNCSNPQGSPLRQPPGTTALRSLLLRPDCPFGKPLLYGVQLESRSWRFQRAPNAPSLQVVSAINKDQGASKEAAKEMEPLAAPPIRHSSSMTARSFLMYEATSTDVVSAEGPAQFPLYFTFTLASVKPGRDQLGT